MSAASHRTLSFMPGETVVRQGDWPHYAYLILSGRARVVHDVGEDEAEVAVLREGDVFGDLALFGLTTRTHSVIADGPLEVATVSKKAMRAAVEALEPALQATLECLSHCQRHVQDARVCLESCLAARAELDACAVERARLEDAVKGMPELPARCARHVLNRFRDSVRACGAAVRQLEQAVGVEPGAERDGP